MDTFLFYLQIVAVYGSACLPPLEFQLFLLLGADVFRDSQLLGFLLHHLSVLQQRLLQLYLGTCTEGWNLTMTASM